MKNALQMEFFPQSTDMKSDEAWFRQALARLGGRYS